MTDNKTKSTGNDPSAFISGISDKLRHDDAQKLLEILCQVTRQDPQMWGPSIIGFGSYHYRYASGREGDSPRVGFSPRSSAMVLYGLVFYDKDELNNKLLLKLGPHKRGKGCLYIKHLADVDESILRQMISNAFSRGDDVVG